MTGDTNKKKLVGRHKRVAFMDVAGDGKTFTRMQRTLQSTAGSMWMKHQNDQT